MAGELAALTEALAARYRLANVSLQTINGDSGKHIYRVQRASGEKYILRAYAANQHTVLLNLMTILSFLEEQNYPAERIVCATNGDSIVMVDGWQLLMTTYIEGAQAVYTLSSMFTLGAALGCLHALSVLLPTDKLLPQAEMLPAREIAYALRLLSGVKPLLTRILYSRYDTLLAALHAIDMCEDLPTVLIHNDCHPANTIYMPTGEVALIDWEGAGLGPAGIDVGFLLSSCDTESPWTPPLPPDPARVNAIVDGYCQHHMLSHTELEYLPDAIRFRALVFGAGNFAAAAKEHGEEDSSDWWWKRYNAAEDIAERARKRFELYRVC